MMCIFRITSTFAFYFYAILLWNKIEHATSYGSAPGHCSTPSHSGSSSAGELSAASYDVSIDDSNAVFSTSSNNILSPSTSYTLKLTANDASAKIKGFLVRLSSNTGDSMEGSFSLSTSEQETNAQFPPFSGQSCSSGVDAVGHRDLGNDGKDLIEITLQVDSSDVEASLDVIIVEVNSSNGNRWYQSTYPLLFSSEDFDDSSTDSTGTSPTSPTPVTPAPSSSTSDSPTTDLICEECEERVSSKLLVKLRFIILR